jgi:hypothetical protein
MTGALDALREAIRALELKLPAELDAVTDPVANANLLAVLRQHRQELHTLEQFVENALAKRMPGKVLEWDGGIATRRKTATNVTWKHADLASSVLVAALVDENGELPSEPVQAVGVRVRDFLFKCAGIAYWRKGELKELGIDPDEYISSLPGRWVVDVDLAGVGS